MKNLFFALITLLTFNFAKADLTYSANSPSLDTVKAYQDSISNFVMSMKDVNGIGVTACDSNGVPFYNLTAAQQASEQFENCLSLFTATDDAYKALSALFPQGVRSQGILIEVENIGVIEAF